MQYTLGQAAKVVGRSKTTIHRAIVSGKLPASRSDVGSYAIDPTELARVYPVDGSANGKLDQAITDPAVRLLVLQADRDRFQGLAEEREATIRDLRARLDVADARVDRLMLADQGRRVPEPEIKPPPVSRSRRLWRWARSSA